MSRLKKYVGTAIVVAIAAALAISSIAFAHGAASTVPVANLSHVFGIGGGTCGQAGLDAVAKALNMTTSDLSAQLWGGRTLADLADKAGVKLTDLQSAVQTACQTAIKDAIQQAVKNGTMSQDQADWLLQGLDKGYWGAQKGFGFGFGMGRRGFRGFGGFGRFGAPQGAPNTNGTTSPSRFMF
jgi:hypothetical protein